MKRSIISILVLIGLWWIAALLIGREVILPLPFTVFHRMISLANSFSFYQAVFATFIRVCISFLLALSIGITLGIFAGLNKRLEQYLSPIMTLLQTIPQIAYILILLVWFKNLTAIIIIVLLMILPVFYNNTINGMKAIEQELQDIIKLYYQPLFFTIRKVYIPLLKSHILAAIESCLPLSFKIGVMAEIFVQTGIGIGTSLYFAKTQIDMVSIFAWTLWMVILLYIIITLYHKVQNKIKIE